DLEGAAADFARALEIHPRSVQAWILAGALRRERKDLAGAEADLTRALAINSRLPEAWCHRAAIRAARGDAEGTAGAISDYGEVLLRDPDYEMGWYERGRLRRRAGDAEGEDVDMSAALRLSGIFVQAYVERAAAREAQGGGRWPDAAADLERALELAGPAWSERAEVLAELARLRDAGKGGK
ncbi:MAG: tetratricopeptide repeat protein, partial [Planctomycetes bacterium]|nr:tetratricopeptide repeat protein [Planctomycetota bacterium]